MSERTEFEMTEQDMAELLEACKPTIALALHCGSPPSPQEKANGAWQRLGERMGFDGMTVRPVPGKSQLFFSAMPLES